MPVNDENAPVQDAAAPEPAVPRLSADTAPLYEMVKRHISDAILMGKWPSGTVLPSEVSLAQSFGVAVGTVRRALVDLTTEGLLARRRKTGTVVTGRSPHQTLRFFFQYFRLHGRSGSLLRSQAAVLSLAAEPGSPEECKALDLPRGAPVLRLRRVRRIDGRPIMHDRFTLPAPRLPGFPDRPEEAPELLYLFLFERYGIRISAVREQVTAELADAEDCALLALTPPAAVLAIDEIAYDQAGTPTILAQHRATTAEHCYINEVR